MEITLELKCEKCGHKWEQTTTEPNVVLVCPKCLEDNKK